MEQVGGAPTDAPAPDEPVQTEGTPATAPAEVGGTPDSPAADSAAVQTPVTEPAPGVENTPPTTPAPAPELEPEPTPDPADPTAAEQLFESRESFHDHVDAILRDPQVPGAVRGFISGLYDAMRYLESVDFHRDDDGVVHARPKEQ